MPCYLIVATLFVYCEVILFCGHNILFFDNIGHVPEHFHLWIPNYMQYNFSEKVFRCDHQFVD